MWTKFFLEEQGYEVEMSRLYQDNQSAMLLEINGKASSSKRTRHVNIRYFFIKDLVSRGELKVEYCPTDSMVADFFTKPLHGKKFLEFRDIIMGTIGPDLTNQERVGNTGSETGMSGIGPDWSPWDDVDTDMEKIPDFDVIKNMKDEDELMSYLENIGNS